MSLKILTTPDDAADNANQHVAQRFNPAAGLVELCCAWYRQLAVLC